MIRLALGALLLAGLAGCTAFSDRVAAVVGRYCAEPPETRAALREALAAATAPHRLHLECAVDSAPAD